MGNKSVIFVVLVALTILFGNIADVKAWMAIGNYHNDAHPGKCTISETIILSPGDEVKHPDQCAKIHCSNADGRVSITGCISIGPPKDCKWGDYVNIHAPYRQCCERHLICENPTNETRAYQEFTRHVFSERRVEERLDEVTVEPTELLQGNDI